MNRAIAENKLESLKQQKAKLFEQLKYAKERVGDIEARIEDLNDRIADCFDDLVEASVEDN